jgi:hypothetical protein
VTNFGGDQAQTSDGRAAEIQEAVLSACLHKNPAGHKYCGGCGGTLIRVPSGSSGKPAPARPETNVQWLRDRSFSSLEVADPPKQRGRLYLAGALAFVLAGLAYLQWAPGFQAKEKVTTLATAGALHPTVPAAPPAESFPPAEVERPVDTILPASQTAPGPNASKTAAAPRPRAARPQTGAGGGQPAAQKSADRQCARVFEESEGGALIAARPTLSPGSMGAPESLRAATLLWAVRKQNTTAAVLLSDLYARGDGVPRSCDQARVLVLAAAKRGSPQAAEQLRRLETHGCQ